MALPTTSSRKAAFTLWSRDRIADLQAMKQAQKSTRTKDPKVQYLRFLQRHATTPKLYWPEFRRKFKKEAEMRDLGMQDKDREKLYREYVSKIKLGEAERKKELVALLKTVQNKKTEEQGTGGGGATITRDMDMDALPETVLRDLRFYTLDERRRDELVKTFIETL